MVLAHGIGNRGDLPIPFGLALAGAALAVVASFAALSVLWPRSRFTGDAAGRALPAGLAGLLDAPALRWAARLLVLLAAVFVVVVGLFGPAETNLNLAPWVLYVTFWVGLIPASLLLGPVWLVVNPARTLYAVWCRVLRVDSGAGLLRLPEGVGRWPAALTLLIFTWLELANPNRDDPRTVATFISAYVGLQLLLGLTFGVRWFAAGDGFEVYSTLVGRLSPLGRRSDGRLVWRNPLDGLDGLTAAPGTTAVVCVLLGSTAFDGLTRTERWQQLVPDPAGAVGTVTLGLLVVIAAVAAAYVAATCLSGRPTGADRRSLPGVFAHSLAPIVVGYAVAHYFSLLVFDGQQPLRLISDPFFSGADFFGTAERRIDYRAVTPTTIAVVQVLAIVSGHIAGVVSAHDRAVRTFPRSAATVAQYPLLAVMVLFTVGGLTLLLGA